MQQVLVNIKNKELEKKLLEESNKKGRKLSNIIEEVLVSFFRPVPKSSSVRIPFSKVRR
jgi:hypothetical protein